MASASILLKLMEALQLNYAQFEKEIKASNGSVSRLVEYEKDISENLKNKIQLRYPDVNRNWLDKGTGPMRAKPDPKRKIILQAIDEVQDEIDSLREKVRLLRKMV